MMKQFLLSAHIVISVLLLSACGGGSKTSSLSAGGDTLTLKYAENLCLVQYPDYTIATLQDPWNKPNLLHTYILVDKHKPTPEHLPEGTVVKVPLERSMVYSSVHCNRFKQLGSQDAV
ncbi:MAG: ABC transporter substrate-binding protein, partial [Bacteroides sp.]|nr:ABC transporter substrate-binding protein [Bacteroides sp.]